MTPCEAATDVAETMLAYRRHKDDWQRQDELWQKMLDQLAVYTATKAAAAAQRLEGL